MERYVLLKLDEGGVGQYDSTIYLQNFELFLALFFYIFLNCFDVLKL
jgi:hypothetical protein